VFIAQLIGIVIARTNITANPNPNAVFTVLDTAKYEHIPKKYESARFSMNADLMNMFINSPMIVKLKSFESVEV